MSILYPKERLGSRPEKDAFILTAIQETLNGNTQAFSVIVEQYTPLLYSLCLRMIGNHEEAEEAVQEIFFKVFSSLRHFRIEKRFLPWIYTIALNYLRSQHRKRITRTATEKSFPHEEMEGRLKDASQTDPADGLMLKEAEAAAARALLELRHEHRQVFVLREIQGFSIKEISTMLKMPEGTVKTFLHRAKQNLCKLILEK